MLSHRISKSDYSNLVLVLNGTRPGLDQFQGLGLFVPGFKWINPVLASIPGFNPTNKKSQKNFWISDQIFGFWILWSYQNSWILFSEFWPAICTKKLDPIFFWFIQKNLRIQNFQEKKLYLRIFVGRIKPWSSNWHDMVQQLLNPCPSWGLKVDLNNWK